jgi:hypothetical protein
MFSMPSLSDIGRALEQVANAAVEGVKKTGEAVGDFAKEHGRDIVNGVAKVAQGMEGTEHLYNPGAGSHLGGGTMTEDD